MQYHTVVNLSHITSYFYDLNLWFYDKDFEMKFTPMTWNLTYTWTYLMENSWDLTEYLKFKTSITLILHTFKSFHSSHLNKWKLSLYSMCELQNRQSNQAHLRKKNPA